MSWYTAGTADQRTLANPNWLEKMPLLRMLRRSLWYKIASILPQEKYNFEGCIQHLVDDCGPPYWSFFDVKKMEEQTAWQI